MKRTSGILYAILSSAAFGFMPIFAKLAYNNGSNALTVLTLRFSLAAIMLYIYFFIKKTDLKISRKQLKIMCLIGIIGYTSTGICLFFSYNYISVGLATTMHFVYPAAVIVMNYIIYKEKLTKYKVFALILSLIGVYILIGVKGQSIHPIGAALAIISGFTYAACVMGMNHPEIKKLDNTISVFYFSLFAGTSLFIFTALSNKLHFDVNFYTISSAIGISFLSTIVSIVLFIKALKIIGSSSTSILGTFEPIVSIIMGIILFGEKITIPIIIGTLLILFSVVIIAKDKEKPREASVSL